MPPILRKYWDQFLLPGPFYSWYAALGWYGALSPLDKGLANNYIGLEHFDQIEYDYLRNRGPAQLGEGVVELLRQEERQRLRDFVQQFDLILNATDHQDDFKFWRRYLQDKIELHEEYPGLVASLGSPKAEQMAAALDTFIDIKATDVAGQVTLVIRGLGQEPFLVHFLPALDNRTLLELFSLKAKLPKGALLKGTEDFVRSLEKFTPHINSILEATRDDLGKGADRLSSYLNTVDFQEREELQLFFEVLEGSDSGGAKKAVAALDDSMLRRLLKTIPAKLRGLLTPRRFVEFLDITLRSPIPELTQGIKDMIEHPSGNFRIDEPFLDEMNRVVAARSRHAPGETLMGIGRRPSP